MNRSQGCFVSQIATEDMLKRVGRFCGECYDELQVGSVMYYDMQRYRYICECCQEKLCLQLDEKTCEIIEEPNAVSLFCR